MHTALRGQQCGADGWACFCHPHTSTSLGSSISLCQTIHIRRAQAQCQGSEPRRGQSQPGWRGLRQDLATVGAGPQPGLQPCVSLTCKSVHSWALLLLEKKLFKVRGLPCCVVQSGKAARRASGLLRSIKAGFGCCPCCGALVTHLQKAATVHDALV